MRKDPIDNTLWDVAVIGGGPAGMMAAVVLIEKNKTLGKKLLITGGGRCNVTNAEFDNRKLLSKFKDSGKFLASTFSQWDVTSSLDFFHTHHMPTKVEAEQRVFPLSNTAQSVWDVLVEYLQKTAVTVMSSAPVTKINAEGGRITSVEVRGGKTIHARSFILATGGKSHPETGSTGDGYAWLRELGHTVNESGGALVPVALRDPAPTASGTSITHAKITLLQNDVKQSHHAGKVLFTHVGLSGPGILNMSREIGELLKYGDVVIEIDLLPDMGYEKVNEKLQHIIKDHANKKIRNAFTGLIPPALVSTILTRAEVDPETPCNSVTRDARVRIMKTLKHLRCTVDHLLGMEKAIITSGGVALTEVDWRTMRSLTCPNLYLVGDILDIDRPSGGYSLQLCWTSGFVAGTNAAQVAKD
jgi:predicted Rossmann fold flavoprotein